MTSYERVVATAVRVTEAVGLAGMFAGGAADNAPTGPAPVHPLEKDPA